MKKQDANDQLKAGTFDPEKAWADAVPMAPEGMPQRLSDMIPEAMRRMKARRDKKEKPIALPWPSVNFALNGGLWPGAHFLIGNTGDGKTQFCLQAALEAAQAGTPVLYIALESEPVEFVARVLGLASKKQWSDLYRGSREHNLEEIEREYAGKLAGLPFHLVFGESRGWQYGQLLEEVQSLRNAYPEAAKGERPILVVLDFLQIVGGPSQEDIRQRISNACAQAGHVARSSNAAVLMASATSRENYAVFQGKSRTKDGLKEADPALGQGWAGRFMGYGKESGELEYSALSVLALTMRPYSETEPTRECWLAIAKQRAGKTGWAELRFNGRDFQEPETFAPVAGLPQQRRK